MLSMTELLKYKKEFERKQDELKEKGLYFCPICKTVKSLTEKSGRRDKCHECWKKEDREYRRRKRKEQNNAATIR